MYVDGWIHSSIIVLKIDEDGATECAHTIMPPENRLMHATGGALLVQGGNGENEQVAVVCGGEFGIYDAATKSNIPNRKCMILQKQEPHGTGISLQSNQLSAGGSLNTERIGAASLAIDNGETLWVTGGRGLLRESELVTIAKDSHFNGFPTNGAGPELQLMHHCFQKINLEVAIVIGGKYSTLPDDGH